MRFAADDIGRIRRGEITAVLRPYERRPIAYRPAGRWDSGLHVIESVADQRRLVSVEGTQPLVLHFQPPKVVYDRVVKNTEEYVEVTDRYRLVLSSLSERSVKALGFDDVESVVDAFCADHGGLAEQTVWLVEFKMATDMPRLLAWPHSGKGGHDDYVHSGHDTLVAEPEGVDAATLDHFAIQNRQRFEDRNSGPIAEAEARMLAVQMKELRKRAARTGIDVTLEVANIRYQMAQIERKLDEEAA